MNSYPKIEDGFGRLVSYLRVSVTDFCNLRCTYCMPPEGVEPLSHEDILRFEEIQEIVSHAAAFGITDIRLTGGEPLVRRGITGLVEMIRKVPGIKNVLLSTNGTLLTRYADELKRAGLDRVNVTK